MAEYAKCRGVPCKHRVMTGGFPPTFVPKNAAQAILCDAKSNS
jgi:hypothetical protein